MNKELVASSLVPEVLAGELGPSSWFSSSVKEAEGSLVEPPVKFIVLDSACRSCRAVEVFLCVRLADRGLVISSNS